MADALKSLSSSMFAFSLPAVSMSSQSLALPPLPEQAAPPSRFGVRGRVTRQPPHRRETGSIAGRSVTTTSPADPRISRVTGPRRSNGRPSLGASESGERQGSEGQSERRAGDESDASPDSEEVDVDVRTPAPGDEKPTASTTLASPDLRAPLLRVDSGSSAIETDPDDADLVLVNSYERRERLYGVIKYLEIAAHQFIIGAFICACAMLSPHQDGCVRVECSGGGEGFTQPFATIHACCTQPNLRPHSRAVFPRADHARECAACMGPGHPYFPAPLDRHTTSPMRSCS